MYTHEALFHDQLRTCLNNTASDNSTGYYAQETGTPQRNTDGTISVFYTVTCNNSAVDNNHVRDLALHAQCILKHDYVTANTASAIYDQPTATCTELRLHLIDLDTQTIMCRMPAPAYDKDKPITPEELAHDIQHAFTRR